MATPEGAKKSLLTKILIGLGVLAVVLQVIRPSRENPVSDPSLAAAAHLRIPPRVATMLRTSCFDCHSNESVWPWYSNIAPASWLVARDVAQGRKRLNFSEWANYPQSRQVSLLGNIAEEVKNEEMPYPPYLILHSEARLSRADRDSLIAWANDEQDRLFSQQDDGGSERE
jgi:hypothetical protein